jgi:hypothetical protein
MTTVISRLSVLEKRNLHQEGIICMTSAIMRNRFGDSVQSKGLLELQGMKKRKIRVHKLLLFGESRIIKY